MWKVFEIVVHESSQGRQNHLISFIYLKVSNKKHQSYNGWGLPLLNLQHPCNIDCDVKSVKPIIRMLLPLLENLRCKRLRLHLSSRMYIAKNHISVALSGSWIDSAVGICPALDFYIWGEFGKSATVSAYECALLKYSAETIGFLSSVQGLVFHVSVKYKMNPVHQWVGAERQNCSSDNDSLSKIIWFAFFDMKWRINWLM